MENKEYTIQELIHNQSFRRMINGRANDEEIKRWNKWIEKSEENREKAKKATAEIAGFQFSGPQYPDVDREWNKLKDDIFARKAPKLLNKRKRHSTLNWIYRIAAVLVLGSLLGIGFYISVSDKQSPTHVEQITEEKTISTEAGEQKTIRFSNESKIVLNHNSEITYTHSNQQQTIEIVVEGEAYFDAKSDETSQQPVFAVSTPDGIIKDVGTKFLVTIQRDRSRVVLEEGKVLINRKRHNEADQITMLSGEMLEFNRSEVLRKQKVNTGFYTSWATGSMEFNRTSIQQFAEFVEQRFDVKVKILDEDLNDIKLDGGIYFRSLEELVRSVSEIAKFSAYQSEKRDTVYIGNAVLK